MIASENELLNAFLHLINDFEEILIFSNRYSDASIKILKHFGKKCRPSCLKNLKCLYKWWHNETVSTSPKSIKYFNIWNLGVSRRRLYIFVDKTTSEKIV